MNDTLSVIVPAYNASRTLERCLKGIREAAYGDFELIVVDDCSEDSTYAVALRQADRVIRHDMRLGEGFSRNTGANIAKGEIFVFIDSDVVVKNDTLKRIESYLKKNPDVSAVTGCLGKYTPHAGFFSQYKNLYMNYIFSKLSDKVTFLYGSLYAIRKSECLKYTNNRSPADTEMGIRLTNRGKHIVFLKELEVTHLKKYTFFSFIANDFSVPFEWAQLFILRGGFKQCFKGKTVFAHAHFFQIISIFVTQLILLFLYLFLRNEVYFLILLFLSGIFFICNYKFINFLLKEKGIGFAVNAVITTFFDNIIMFVGILCGTVKALLAYVKINFGKFKKTWDKSS